MSFSIWPTESRVGAYQNDYSDRVREAQLAGWILDRGRSPLAAFVADGLEISGGDGMTVNIASGRAFINGFMVVNSTTFNLSGIQDDDTNYIWLSLTRTSGLVTDATFSANTTGVAPSSDSVLVGKAVLVSGATTPYNSLVNPRINSGSYVADYGGAVELFLGAQPKAVVVTIESGSYGLGINMTGRTGSGAVGFAIWSPGSIDGLTTEANYRPEITSFGFKKPFNSGTGITSYWQAWF